MHIHAGACPVSKAVGRWDFYSFSSSTILFFRLFDISFVSAPPIEILYFDAIFRFSLCLSAFTIFDILHYFTLRFFIDDFFLSHYFTIIFGYLLLAIIISISIISLFCYDFRHASRRFAAHHARHSLLPRHGHAALYFLIDFSGRFRDRRMPD
jgi:hypothetical protein